MDAFSWDEKYRTGHEEIDLQHGQLFTLLNGLHAAMKKSQGRDQIDKTLAELVAYAQKHFQVEEEVMRQTGYPELDEHCQLHQRLTERLAALTQARRCGTQLTTFEVLNFLGEWIVDHVGRSDARIGRHLRRMR